MNFNKLMATITGLLSCTLALVSFPSSAEAAVQGLGPQMGHIIVEDFLICVEDAQAAGVPRDEARSDCRAAVQGLDTQMGHIIVQDFLICVEETTSTGVSRDDARAECKASLFN